MHLYILTHVEGDRDDVQGHGGVCDAAEGGRLDIITEKNGKNVIVSDETYEADFQSRVSTTSCPLTLSMFEAFGFRRRRRCRLMRREELCSVELLNLRTVCSGAKHNTKLFGCNNCWQKLKYTQLVKNGTLPEKTHFLLKTVYWSSISDHDTR